MKRFICIVVIALYCLSAQVSCAFADVLFESGTLGPTGVSYTDLGDTVPGTNVNRFVFPGVRFELTQPVVTLQMGGHFVVQGTSGTFFGAIVKLNDENDFPDSADLSTPDVLGATTLTFPNPSAEVYAELNRSLDPGWYALVFGSGLFGASGAGGAVRNGMDIGDPVYIGLDPNSDWFNLDILPLPFDNHRFVVMGVVVPEPSVFCSYLTLLIVISSLRQKRRYRAI